MESRDISNLKQSFSKNTGRSTKRATEEEKKDFLYHLRVKDDLVLLPESWNVMQVGLFFANNEWIYP
jgi:hypothetical protein